MKVEKSINSIPYYKIFVWTNWRNLSVLCNFDVGEGIIVNNEFNEK